MEPSLKTGIATPSLRDINDDSTLKNNTVFLTYKSTVLIKHKFDILNIAPYGNSTSNKISSCKFTLKSIF